jgi:hypothetical protein
MEFIMHLGMDDSGYDETGECLRENCLARRREMGERAEALSTQITQLKRRVELAEQDYKEVETKLTVRAQLTHQINHSSVVEHGRNVGTVARVS